MLAPYQKTGILNHIAGQDKAGSGGVFQTISPDESVICDVRGTKQVLMSSAAYDALVGVICQRHLVEQFASDRDD